MEKWAFCKTGLNEIIFVDLANRDSSNPDSERTKESDSETEKRFAHNTIFANSRSET
jgi:hypothetical protein